MDMGRNERGAGRKPILSEQQLADIKKRHEQGETVTALAQEYGISRQALSCRLHAKKKGTEAVYRTLEQWRKLNQEFPNVEPEHYNMRMEFMCKEECCTIILVNFKDKKIEIKNETGNILHRAFGIKAKPDWEDFELFLKERCFPESRQGASLLLEELELDSYDPLAIIEKTQGRMAEDLQWIRLSYYAAGMEERRKQNCKDK